MASIATRTTFSPTTVSTWNKCMTKAYCKWPVIVGIIIGSLIILSLVWCCARCLCCGLSCCCDCFRCCGGSGGGRRNHRNNKEPQYADPPGGNNFQPAPYQGYQPPTNQSYQSTPGRDYSQQPSNQGYQSTPQAPIYEPPQFAQFDVGRKKVVNEDALPEMPSWENASSRKVLEEHDGDVEMGALEPTQAQKVPMLAVHTASPTTGYAEADSHLVGTQYGQAQSPHTQVGQHAYGAPGPRSPSAQQAYGAPGPRSTSAQQAYGQAQNPYSPVGQQAYGAPGPRSPPAQQAYGGVPQRIQPQQNYSDQPAQPAYSAYAPSESTRYAPSSSPGPAQELGTVYSPHSPPPQQSPYGNSGGFQAPGVLQAGRKPAPNTWREV